MIQSSKKAKITTLDIVLTGILTSLVFIFTYFVNFTLPFSFNGGGLVHCGNVMLFIAAIAFGKEKGAIAGAFGMGLFDLVSGYIVWAPFTFIIRGAMGYLVGYIAHLNGAEGKKIGLNLLAMILSAFILIPGYYITQVILFGNWIAPLSSIPGDISQLVIGLFAIVLVPPVIKAYEMATKN